MGNLNLILFLCIMTPLAMMLFVFRGDSRTVLSFLMIGIFMCLFSGEISGLLLRITGLSSYDATVHITPVVEEVLKAAPVVFFTFLFNPKRQLLLECALSVGVGFAILENAYILSGMVSQVTVGWALVRGFGAGMMHGICTLTVGYSMTFIHTKRKLFYTGSLAALSVAIIYHSIYNMVIQSPYSSAGILLPLLTYIPLILHLKKRRTL